MGSTIAEKKLAVCGLPYETGTTGIQYFGFDRQTVGGGLLLILSYFAAAKISVALRFPSNPLTVMWLPNGVLLAALLITPRRWWWFYLAASVPAHLVAQGSFNLSWWRLLWQIAFNCGVSIVSAEGLLRFVKSPLGFDRLRQVGFYVFVTAAASAVVSLAAPAVVLHSIEAISGAGSWVTPLMDWRRVLMANYLSFLFLTPVVVLWADHGIARLLRMPPGRVTEAGLICIGLAAVAIASVAIGADLPAEAPLMLFVFFPFLLWAAVRLGPLGMSSFLMVVGIASVWLAIHGYGSFGWTTSLDHVFPLQLFLVLVSVNLICLTAVIAERGKVEAGLRESEARFRTMADTAPVMIWTSGPDGECTYLNQRWLHFTGRSLEDVLGDGWMSSYHPEDIDHRVSSFRAAIGARAPVAVESRLRRQDGEYRWILTQAVPRLTPAGEFLGYVGSCVDITDHKHAEDVNRNLAHVQRLAIVGELTASIAHEINQPLNAVLNFADAAEMLLESEHPPLDEVRQIMVDIRQADLRAAEVVRRTRVLLRRREVEMAPIDLNETISEVLRLIAGDARRRRVVLTSNLGDLPSRIPGDKAHVQQLLLNLLLNGMDALADLPLPRRKLAVLTKQTGEYCVEVAVSDTGPGIAPERLGHLFESFYTTKKEGLGLGLSIAQSIVEAHHGRIWAENNPGGGATFRFALPIGAIPATAAKAPTPEPVGFI